MRLVPAFGSNPNLFNLSKDTTTIRCVYYSAVNTSSLEIFLISLQCACSEFDKNVEIVQMLSFACQSLLFAKAAFYGWIISRSGRCPKHTGRRSVMRLNNIPLVEYYNLRGIVDVHANRSIDGLLRRI